MSVWELIIIYIIVIYYFTIFENRRKNIQTITLLVFILFISFNTQVLNPSKSISFLDVEGDSTFIQDNFDNCNILIDTGEPDDYDSVINYLLSNNIKRLDYLIISHFHSDHYGEMSDIIDEFDVTHIITPDNSESIVENYITCGSLGFYIYDLSTQDINENNNSIMLSVFIEDRHFLFTGDAEESREIEFINKYQIDVDYLKIAHHGSKTSSSVSFLESVKPEEAFVMVYRYNKFDHPDVFVMHRFKTKNIPVYRTDLLGTIEVEYFFGFERKKYNKP